MYGWLSKWVGERVSGWKGGWVMGEWVDRSVS